MKKLKQIMYYLYNKVLSYGYEIIAVIGARGIGKTYGAKRKIIKDFIHRGSMFIWLRDNENALLKIKANRGAKFFSDVRKEFTQLDAYIEGETFFINGKPAGYLLATSTFYNHKGSDFSDIKNIVFDEFIQEKGQRTNTTRVAQFLNMIETIGRTRNDYRVFMLANSLDRGDEILQLLGVKIKDFGIYLNKKKRIVVHYCANNPVYDKAHKDSIAGRLITDTALENEIMANKFNSDNKMFYDKKPSGSKLFCILHSESGSCRVYMKDSVLYVSKDFNFNNNTKYRYVNDINMINSNSNLIPDSFLDSLKRIYILKQVLFENDFVKNIYVEFIRKR